MPKLSARDPHRTVAPYATRAQAKKPPPSRLPDSRPTVIGLVLACGSNGVSGAVGVHPDKIDEISHPRKIKAFTLLKPVVIVAGSMHSAALDSKGKLYTCGVNDQGCLGRITKGSAADRVEELESTPSLVQGEAATIEFVKVVAGDNITAALSADGRLFACGCFLDAERPIGFLPNKKDPQKLMLHIDPKKKYIDVACGFNHVLALTTKGTITSFGDNTYGQLGRRVGPRNIANALRPESVIGLRKIEKIWAGGNQSFAQGSDGTVYSWGANSVGQLGHPKSVDPYESIIARPIPIENIKDVAIGDFHTLFLKEDNAVHSIGRADRGFLGVGQFAEPDTHIPQFVTDNVDSVAAGNNHSIAVKLDGSVYVWGSGAGCTLGLGEDDDEDRFVPTLIDESIWKGGRVIAASGGAQHTLYLVQPTAES